jgi:hypothetical protein
MQSVHIGGDWRLVYSDLIPGSEMPRIGEDFLDSVLYLYRSRHEAKEGINIGGSGFLVSVATQRAPGLSFIYAVTNRHVIEKADVIRFNTKEGIAHAAKFARNTWIESKTDDLAIRPINVTDLPSSPICGFSGPMPRQVMSTAPKASATSSLILLAIGASIANYAYLANTIQYFIKVLLHSNSTTCPSRKVTRRSMREANSMLCVAMMVARPEARTNWVSAANPWSAVCRSRFPVGSSAKKMRGALSG